ncbi:MAG: alpha/beta fold hydrolase [Myxococcales bacterium]|nr:alpha/beta fold hydrolase [Myxococcales bacterium]MCB9521337.1 alpha/beta fold hydrolase [Myxococcales bacterium]
MRQHPLAAALIAALLAACGEEPSPDPAGGASDVAGGDASDSAAVSDAAVDAEPADGSEEPADGGEEPAETSPDPFALAAPFLARGPNHVSSWSSTIVDTSRPTAANGSFEGAPERTFPLTVWYPDDATAPSPLVVYCHGFMSARGDNRAVAELLASHGFTVAAVDFPLTNRTAPGGANIVDIANQPADVSFLIDQLGAMGDAPFAPHLDLDDIAVVGVSLGAMTSLLVGFHPDYLDERVDAVIAAAPPACYAPVELLATRSVPLLLLHGDRDAIVPYAENATPAYEAAVAPKALVTVLGGNHTNFADAALLMSALPNPDTIGCTAIASQIPEGELGALAESLGGRSAAEVDAECPRPCAALDSFPEAIDVQDQVDIFSAAVVAWCRAYLVGDEAAAAAVRDGLTWPDVSTVAEELSP